jgi:hypothetical protein
MNIDKPVSENLNAAEPDTGGEAKGNCVAVRRGGKQPAAKEQSQTKVNSIRYLRVASLRVNGEVCAKREPSPWHRPVNAELSALRYGWSGNVLKDVYESGESCADRRRARVRTVQQSESPYELGSPVMRMEQRETGK